MSAGDYTFNFLAIGSFDPNSCKFTDWFAVPFIQQDPFSHLKSLSF